MADGPGWFDAGGLFSSSGNGLFASNGTYPTAANPNAVVPGYAADNYTPLAGGDPSGKNLTAALNAASQVAGKSAGGPGTPLPVPTFNRTAVGQPHRAIDINQLVQALLKQQEELTANATSGPGRGQVLPQPRVAGLLGF